MRLGQCLSSNRGLTAKSAPSLPHTRTHTHTQPLYGSLDFVAAITELMCFTLEVIKNHNCMMYCRHIFIPGTLFTEISILTIVLLKGQVQTYCLS